MLLLDTIIRINVQIHSLTLSHTHTQQTQQLEPNQPEAQSKEELWQQQVAHEQELADLRRAHAETIASMKANMSM